MMINVMEIKLPEEGKNAEFAKKFNEIGDLYRSVWEEGITEEESRKRFDVYMSWKYCLEQGII